MKALLRNKQTFYYALFKEKTDATDSAGYKTGEKLKTYYAPVAVQANISAARGTADLDAFGINQDYSRTIVTDDLTIPIDKSAIIWIDAVPDANGEAGAVKHNYCVVQVAKSLNSVTIAVKEVSVS